MRLIDADAMNEELFYKQVGGKDSLITAESAFKMIDAQPTAYDVEAVVEQLKTKKARTAALQKASEYFEGETDAFEVAIKIVKDGES